MKSIMRFKFLIMIVLILSGILVSLVESFGAEAKAYASIIIIIPPRNEKEDTKVTESQAPGQAQQKDSTAEKDLAYAKDQKN